MGKIAVESYLSLSMISGGSQMRLYISEFTQRQTMDAPFFELYHYYDTSPPEVDYHFHDFYEVLLFISGDVTYSVEGKSYLLRPGDVLLTHPQDIHRPFVASGKPYERYVLWISERFIANSKEVGDDLSACFVDARDKSYRLIRPDEMTLRRLKKLCDQYLATSRSEEFGTRTLLYSIISDFAVYLNRAYFDTPDSICMDVTEDATINAMISYLMENLNQELTLDSLAQRFHLSKYHLGRKFQQYTGLTIYQFIMKKRLIFSRSLLFDGAAPLEACMESGFGDYSNFSKAFKREYGISPGNINKLGRRQAGRQV